MPREAGPIPVILFYNLPYPGMLEGIDQPCEHGCEFTTDHRRLAAAAALVVHLPNLAEGALPARRRGQWWVAWSMESRVNVPALSDGEFMRRFDMTMTYERQATVWCPYFGPAMAQDLLRPPRPKTEASPAVHFRSNRLDHSGRGRYAFELMKGIKVDSYGAVLRNRELPEPDRGRDTRLATLARYKFTLAFENSIAPDYVTEKFFDPLTAGSVPVYLGAPNVAEFAPGPRSFINVADFRDPAALASYLNDLDRDDRAYAEYLAWKEQGLTPAFRAHLDALREPAFCRLCRALGERGGDDAGRA